MEFNFTSEQLEFRDAIRRFLMVEAAPEFLREIWETDSGRSPILRQRLAEQGLTAVSVPESLGGLGLDDVTWCLLLQELGYFAIPDSLVDSAYLGVSVLREALPHLAAADRAEAEALLGQIAEGSLRVAVRHPVNRWVADAGNAGLLIWLDDQGLAILRPGDYTHTPQPSLDLSRRISRVTATPKQYLLTGLAAQTLLHAMEARGAQSVSAQLVGLSQRMLDLAIDYTSSRKQFGKPVGSFQAVKHLLADVATSIEFSKPAVAYASAALASGAPHALNAVRHAKLLATESALLAARNTMQSHGAMGYTWEVDLQMFMKRAWVLGGWWGDSLHHQSALWTALSNDPAAWAVNRGIGLTHA